MDPNCHQVALHRGPTIELQVGAVICMFVCVCVCVKTLLQHSIYRRLAEQ